jgi:small subunit ribosomal protein S9
MNNEIKDKKSDIPKFKGKYISASGRRKRSLARVRLYKNGKGLIIINEVKFKDFFPPQLQLIPRQPLKLAGCLKDYDFSIFVSGGGKRGQADAARHGIAQAIVLANKDAKPAIKAKGFLTRDARKKERKKPGLKKARRAPQWSKR